MPVNQLKIVFSILKEISEGNVPNAEDYGVEKQKFYDILDAMQNDGLVSNIRFNRGNNNNAILAIYKDAKITIKGMEYLNKNSAFYEDL